MNSPKGQSPKGSTRPPPVPKTFCRILGKMAGPGGKTYTVVEEITGAAQQQEARERYEAAMRRLLWGDRTDKP